MLGRWYKNVGKTAGSLAALLTLTVSALESPRQIASVEGITEYRLANGLQVILFPDPSKPTITVNMTYLVGSRHESYGETGMAHLLEHLVFKGTPRHPNIPQELTERGASPNGTTSMDRTNYFETLPATDENLEWALDLESDRMINSFISAEDLKSEMTVVRTRWSRAKTIRSEFCINGRCPRLISGITTVNRPLVREVTLRLYPSIDSRRSIASITSRTMQC